MVKPIKVLVIDDHPQTATSIATMLDYRGYKSYEAYTYEQAIKLIESEKPDLLVLDFVLENNGGEKLLESYKNIKTILISAFDISSKAKKYKQVSSLLQKPIGPDELEKAVEKIKF